MIRHEQEKPDGFVYVPDDDEDDVSEFYETYDEQPPRHAPKRVLEPCSVGMLRPMQGNANPRDYLTFHVHWPDGTVSVFHRPIAHN